MLPAQAALAWLPRQAMAAPRRALAAMAALVLLAAPGILRLELRTDGHALVPAGDPAILADHEVRQRFGLADVLVVLIDREGGESLWQRDTLELVADLSAEIAALEGIAPHGVTSLATESRDRIDSIDFSPFLSPLPQDAAEMAALREDVAAAGILHGTLISRDEKAVTLLVAISPASGADRSRLCRRIAELAAAHDRPPHRVAVVGAPMAEALLGDHILQDLVRLLPLSLAVIAAMLWLGCRRLWGVALGLAEVGACLLFTFGLMGWAGVPVYLTTAVLPVILTAVGLADEVHLFWFYQRCLARREAEGDGGAREALRTTFREMSRAVTLTSLTTAAGFFSFLASDIEPVRAFGLFAAAGVLFCLLWSLVAVPAQLTLLPAAALRRPVRAQGAARGRFAGLPDWLLRRSGAILAGLALITALAAAGLPRLVVQDGWISGFAPGSPFRLATERAHEALLGTHLLLAELDFDPPPERLPEVRGERAPPLYDPELLEALGALEAFARGQPQVGGVLGPFSHLTSVGYLARGRLEGTRSIPDSPVGVRRLWLRFDDGRGVHRRREVADDALRRTVVTLFLRDANYRQTAQLMAAFEQEAARILAPWRPRLTFAGDVAVSQAMIPALVEGQLRSLAFALAGAFLLIAWLAGPRLALLAILPPAVAVLWLGGLMGWLGVSLGVATSMFCAVTLGIGVDFAIHFLERRRRARQAGAREPDAAALREAGPAILVDSLAMAAGFGILAFSQVPANARLGLIVAAALASCALLTLAGLPSLLGRRWYRVRGSRGRREDPWRDAGRESP